MATRDLRYSEAGSRIPQGSTQAASPLEGIAPVYKILYKIEMDILKPIAFQGTSLDDLRAFPITAKRDAGYQLDRVQQGLQPDDWKPMSTVGTGVSEIRIRDEAGAFRIIYVAKFAAAVYVLHCFQKKSQKTSAPDIEIATRRYRDLLQELSTP